MLGMAHPLQNLIVCILLVFASVGCARLNPGGVSPTRWKVTYDHTLSADFFNQDQHSLPWNIVEHDDGSLEDTLGGSTKNIPRLRHTADCTSSYLGDHSIRFAEAWIEADGVGGIYVHDFTASTNDHLLIIVKNRRFSVHYWTHHIISNENPTWRVLSASIVLDGPLVTVGQTLRGFIDVQLVGTSPNGGHRTNRIRGYIKPQVSMNPPDEVRSDEAVNQALQQTAEVTIP
jgi:hypothetical protein